MKQNIYNWSYSGALVDSYLSIQFDLIQLDMEKSFDDFISMYNAGGEL